MHKNTQIVFTNTTVNTIGKHQSQYGEHRLDSRTKYEPCKARHTLGEWENKSGKFIGEMYVNGENPFAHESCLDVGGKFNLYHKGNGDELLHMVCEFKPVYSYYMEGDESVDTMSWKGFFQFMGKMYSWQGECVWEISQHISDMLELYHMVAGYDDAKPESVERVLNVIYETLEERHGAYAL
jgi:hypothetical protein